MSNVQGKLSQYDEYIKVSMDNVVVEFYAAMQARTFRHRWGCNNSNLE